MWSFLSSTQGEGALVNCTWLEEHTFTFAATIWLTVCLAQSILQFPCHDISWIPTNHVMTCGILHARLCDDFYMGSLLHLYLHTSVVVAFWCIVRSCLIGHMKYVYLNSTSKSSREFQPITSWHVALFYDDNNDYIYMYIHFFHCCCIVLYCALTFNWSHMFVSKWIPMSYYTFSINHMMTSGILSWHTFKL